MKSNPLRIAYTSHDECLRRELAEALGRKLLEDRTEDSFFKRIKKTLSPGFLERWARTHGPDSAEIRSSLRGGIPLVFEAGANVGFTWTIDRKMENKSSEEIALFARSVLGRADTCQELAFFLREQARNPKSVDTRRLVLKGDFRRVRGEFRISGKSHRLQQDDVEIALDFGDEPLLNANGRIIRNRGSEIIGKLVGLNPIELRCFCIWI